MLIVFLVLLGLAVMAAGMYLAGRAGIDRAFTQAGVQPGRKTASKV